MGKKLKGRKPYISLELWTPAYKPIPSVDHGRIRLVQSSLNQMQVVVIGGGFPSYSTSNVETARRLAMRRKNLLTRRRHR